MTSSLPSLVHFHTLEFLIFFAITWTAYWLLPIRYRIVLLVFASYFFYASWDYRFLPILLVSTLVNYFCTMRMDDDPVRKKIYLALCIGTDVLLLALFKYTAIVSTVLPLGISFYTFQTISYSIDAYRGRLKVERNYFNFALFVSFFPQLIAGPIERAVDLLPQLKESKLIRSIDYKTAIYLFVYGMFKKRVLGDYFALLVRDAFEVQSSQGVSVILGVVAYTLQAFCDISGYTDMARGLALGFGIKLTSNFNFPFFLKNPSEFWARWHISLSQWVKHYVYIPLLVRSRNSILAVAVAFLFVSLWYGPHLHFLIWGAYWTAIVVFYHYAIRKWKTPTWLNNWIGYPLTLVVVIIGMSLFRATDLAQWLDVASRSMEQLTFSSLLAKEFGKFYLCCILLIGYEYFQYKKGELFVSQNNFYIQATFYVLLYFIYRNLGSVAALDFIYFGY